MKKNADNKLVKIIAGGFIFAAGLTLGLLWDKDGKSEKPAEPQKIVEVEEPSNEELPMAVTPEIGTPAPDFELEVLGDKEKTVSLSDYKGKKVLVHFFVSWCQFCREQADDNEKFFQEIKDNEDVELILVNLTAGEESLEDVNKHLAEFGISSQVLLDYDGYAAFEYNIQRTPTNVFVNEDGSIFNISEGALTFEEIQALISDM